MIKYCGIALCALAAILILRAEKSEFAGYVSLAASVILLGAALTTFLPMMEYIKSIMSKTEFGPYLETLTKALGITLCVQVASDICRDLGEGAMGARLELIGKAEILLLCLPLISELLELAAHLIKI